MNRREFLKSAVTGSMAAVAGTAAFAGMSRLAAAKPVSITASMGSSVASKETLKKFDSIIGTVKKNNWQPFDIGSLTGNIGKLFIDTPYVGGTLDPTGPERSIADFTGLDCVTLFENSLGIARIIKKGKFTFGDLLDEIKFTRYRGGRLSDYTSRLHYTADWFYDNEQKGVVDDISKELGGKKFPYKVYFMSKNPKYYRALRENESLVPVIAGFEDKINARAYYFIPKDKIARIEGKLQTGDIVAFATNKKGLDYAHTGLVFIDGKGQARLLHASSKDKIVKLDTTISEYANKIETNIGISIARPLDIKTN